MNINTEAILIESVLKDKRLKDLNLSEDTLKRIIDVYYDNFLDTLVDCGKVDYQDKFRVSIYALTPRIHVLRGKAYDSTKRYKLKLSIDSTIHNRISEVYDEYKE